MAPIFSRKRDLIYAIFFMIHIPVMLAVDLYPLYPPSFRPSWMMQLREWYIKTYQDRFFIEPPAWFSMYLWLEAIYHIPVSCWAVQALWRDDPKVPLHLLVYGIQTAVTTLTAICDYLNWEGFQAEQKLQLGYLYVPYLALAVFMSVDMFRRLETIISQQRLPKGKQQ